jgi:hypothetical protein
VFQFGVRYTQNGKRRLDTAATLDEALAIMKDRNVRLYAKQSGVALPGTNKQGSTPRLTMAEAVEQYFSDKVAVGKDHITSTRLRCHLLALLF